ncbi:MAG: hypothetical protein CMJ83_03020 [Planctomycetes bacterium]|nr:hypothetical protein [Planctomycetota bacterium]
MIKIKPMLCLVGAALSLAACATPRNETPTPTAIGTFDSRAIAAAYYRSEVFGKHLSGLRAELAKAKADGDSKREKELGEQGPAIQALAHRQTFCTEPVTDILEHAAHALPAIAKQAGVTLIVSRWDVAYGDASASSIDVTDLLVQVFEPDDATLKVISELAKQDPLPLSAVQNHDH